jgi:hypothetical protein
VAPPCAREGPGGSPVFSVRVIFTCCVRSAVCQNGCAPLSAPQSRGLKMEFGYFDISRFGPSEIITTPLEKFAAHLTPQEAGTSICLSYEDSTVEDSRRFRFFVMLLFTTGDGTFCISCCNCWPPHCELMPLKLSLSYKVGSLQTVRREVCKDGRIAGMQQSCAK